MKDCTTCKYGYEDERLGIPMCHHPKRFSEDCVDFNMHEEKEIKESKKPVPNDLEEAAEEYRQGEVDTGCDYIDDSDGDSLYYSACLADAFIAGAKWQKEHQFCSDAPKEKSVGGNFLSSHKDKNLDEIAQDYVDGVKQYNQEPTWDLVQTAVCYGAGWQKDQFEKNRLAHCDALSEEDCDRETDFAMEIIEKEHRQPTFIDAINYGMRLQVEKDKETIELAEEHAYFAGAVNEREQMMKGAVEGKVFMSFAPGHNQMVMADVDLPTNTKVKVIVIPED